MPINKLLAIVFGSFLFLVVTIGCAGRPYLIVDYSLPEASKRLEGQTVQLVIKDLRQESKIFTPSAAAQFEGFKDRYSLAWIENDGTRILAGEHDLKGLFRESFQKRLEILGVRVTDQESSHAPVFEVILRRFKIDLSSRMWQADVSYEATLSKDSQLIARESIQGTAERVKIIGRKGADTVLSDIFSDIINRADIVKLFEQAKLIL